MADPTSFDLNGDYSLLYLTQTSYPNTSPAVHNSGCTPVHAVTQFFSTKPPVQGPSSSDWLEQRNKIIDLYIKQNKTLPQVMEIMEARGFYASVKMYKNRFKAWGIDNKHLKKNEAIAMFVHMRNLPAGAKLPTFLVRGRSIHGADILRHIRRARLSTHEIGRMSDADARQILRNIVILSEPDNFYHLKSPGDLRVLEFSHHAMTSYLQGAFDAEICYVHKFGSMLWKNDVYHDAEKLNGAMELALKWWNDGDILAAGTCWRLASYLLETCIFVSNPRFWMDFASILHSQSLDGIPEVTAYFITHVLKLVERQTDIVLPHKELIETVCCSALNQEQFLDIRNVCNCSMLQIYSKRLHQIFVSSDITPIRGLFVEAQATLVSLEDSGSYHPGLLWTEENDTIFSQTLYRLKARGNILRELGDWTRLRDICSCVLDMISLVPRDDESDECALQALLDKAGADFRLGNYKSWRLGIEEFLHKNSEYKRRYNTTFLHPGQLWHFRALLDELSNASDSLNSDEQWRIKMHAVKKEMEDELNAAVGNLSLDADLHD